MHTHKHTMMSNSNIVTQHDIYNIDNIDLNIWNIVFLYFCVFLLQRVVVRTYIELNVTFGHPIHVILFCTFFPTVPLFLNLQKLLIRSTERNPNFNLE